MECLVDSGDGSTIFTVQQRHVCFRASCSQLFKLSSENMPKKICQCSHRGGFVFPSSDSRLQWDIAG